MATPGYRLLDEPRPTTLARVAVRPLWILLSCMLGGVWLGWPWFLLNSAALGSPTRRREVGAVVVGLAGAAAMVLGILWLWRDDGPSPGGRTGVRLALLAVLLWKITVSYYLTVIQARTVGLYEHFGGQLQNGALVALGSFLVSSRVEAALPLFWKVLLS